MARTNSALQALARRYDSSFITAFPNLMGAEFYTLFQALIALLLGGLLGWEREKAGKWAGLRTHMLVCLGALLFVKIGQFLILNAESTMSNITLRTDPVRVIEAIMTGVAFLGAGTIFRDPDYHRAHGLTTAASLLIVAPIGIAVAIERYILAIGITLIALFILRIVRRFEVRPPDVVGKTSETK